MKIKVRKPNLSGAVMSIFEIIVGILLLIEPVRFTTGIITVAGFVLMLVGAINVIKYFRYDADKAAEGQFLSHGLMELIGGAVCLFRAKLLVTFFPMLTVVYGIVMVAAGLGKLQVTVDLLRRKSKKWFIPLISAVISLACGWIVIGDPFGSTQVIWIVAGATLIVLAVVDILTVVLRSIEIKSNEEAEKTVEEKTAVAQTE